MTISVYITSYNQRDFLVESIKSVLDQTLQPHEIIVVDDASTDGSQAVIKEFADEHPIIKYRFHLKNKGVAETRRTALSMVEGDLVTYVDGDDLYLPHKLELEHRLIVQTASDVVFSNNVYVKEQNPDVDLWVWIGQNIEIDLKGNLFVKTLTRDYPNSSLFRMEMIKRSFLEKIGYHDPNLKIYEDYDLRIRLSKSARMAYSKEITSKIRYSKAGLSKSGNELHYKSLSYIFNKYKNDVANLDPKIQEKVLAKQNEILEHYRPKRSNLSAGLFKKILRKMKK